MTALYLELLAKVIRSGGGRVDAKRTNETRPGERVLAEVADRLQEGLPESFDGERLE